MVVMVMCFQVEADLGYPGGKAKIIHKESDIIMAFAINKVRVTTRALYQYCCLSSIFYDALFCCIDVS